MARTTARNSQFTIRTHPYNSIIFQQAPILITISPKVDLLADTHSICKSCVDQRPIFNYSNSANLDFRNFRLACHSFYVSPPTESQHVVNIPPFATLTASLWSSASHIKARLARRQRSALTLSEPVRYALTAFSSSHRFSHRSASLAFASLPLRCSATTRFYRYTVPAMQTTAPPRAPLRFLYIV